MADKGHMVPALVEFLAEVTGEPASTLGQIARRTREAGYLSQAGHGRAGATASSKDAATILMVSMCTNTAIQSGPVVEALSALERDEAAFDGAAAPETLAGLKVRANDSIGVVSEIIDALRRRDENFKGIAFLQMNTRVDRGATVPSGPHVTIYWGNDDDMLYWRFSAPANSGAMARYIKVAHQSGTRGMRGMDRIVKAEGWILVALADWLEGRETV